MITAPYFTTQRVFQSDEGWTFAIEWWSGNVDYHNAPPTGRADGRAYKTPQQASVAMIRKLESIVRGARSAALTRSP